MFKNEAALLCHYTHNWTWYRLNFLGHRSPRHAAAANHASPRSEEVLFLTLRLLCSHFGEEGNLSDSDKWQTQNLQKHPDDELSQLPREATWRAKQSIAKCQMNK